MIRVLVLDDDGTRQTNLRQWLTGRGLVVETASGAHPGLAAATGDQFDVVVLDLGLDGGAMSRRLRRSGVGTPILMLSDCGAVADRVRGLEAGADDYLVKPVALAELEARIRALVRRHLGDRSAVLHLADLELDTATGTATVAGEPLRLSPKEARLLEFLLHGRGRPLSQETISLRLWASRQSPPANLVDVHVSRLRRKLSGAGSRVTVASRKRQGYLLEGRSSCQD